MKTDKINRLIDLKTEHLNGLRQDYRRLEQLVTDSKKLHQQALSHYDGYTKQIHAMEADGTQLLAVDMIDRRRFLATLHKEVSSTTDALAEVVKQHEYAQQGLKQAYVEVKSLELLAERKTILKKHQDNRKLFTLADDEHAARIVQIGE